jgi:transposase-like protein
MVKFLHRRERNEQEKTYTLEFKLAVVRLVKGGRSVPVTGKLLGVPAQTQGNRVRLSEKGQLQGAGDKPVSPEQMELARLPGSDPENSTLDCSEICANERAKSVG